jgi:putative transposase
MKISRKNYSPEFKAKVVLELLQENKTINEIASKYGILPKSLIEWKKQFLENAALAFDKSSVVKEYKQEIENLKEENEKLAKKLGKVIVERDWLQGKLKSLDLLIRKTLIDNSEGVQAKTQKNPSLSINRQLELLSISKTAYYYTKKEPFSSKNEISMFKKFVTASLNFKKILYTWDLFCALFITTLTGFTIFLLFSIFNRL